MFTWAGDISRVTYDRVARAKDGQRNRDGWTSFNKVHRVGGTNLRETLNRTSLDRIQIFVSVAETDASRPTIVVGVVVRKLCIVCSTRNNKSIKISWSCCETNVEKNK